MQLCAITDRRRALGRDDQAEGERTSRLVALAADWSSGGVHYIQVREKDLDDAALASLVQRIVAAVKANGRLGPRAATKVLVNGSAAVALAGGADGVHLPGGFDSRDVDEIRRRFAPRAAVVSAACHSMVEVASARLARADLVLFAPVFEKRVDAGPPLPGVGLALLAAACRAAGQIPVFALGGVTAANAQPCLEAGAAGVAAIRMFINEDWRALARTLTE